MTTHREERKQLKQKLFHIRRYTEGERVKLDKELGDLKKSYEKLPGFTSWSDFPEKWDVGDPHGVKAGAFAFDDAAKRTYQRANGKSYETIIRVDQPDSPAAALDDLYNMLCASISGLRRIHPEDAAQNNLRAGYIELNTGEESIRVLYVDSKTCTVQVHGVVGHGTMDVDTINEMPSYDILTALNHPSATALRDALVSLSFIQPTQEESDTWH